MNATTSSLENEIAGPQAKIRCLRTLWNCGARVCRFPVNLVVAIFKLEEGLDSHLNSDRWMPTSSRDEFPQLQKRIHRARSQRNPLISIHHLPPEVLTKIFKFIKESTRNSAGFSSWDVYDELWTDNRWMQLTFVCRYFRDVASSEPSFWTDISIDWREDFIELCARRARDHPLTVRAVEKPVQDVGKLERFLASYASRVVAMHLNMDPQCDSLYRQTTARRFPSLRWLKCTSTGRYHIDRSFLGGACHSLTTLKLFSVSMVSEEMPELPALRKLVITNLEIGDDFGPLFSMLTGSPLLEYLHIYGIESRFPIHSASDIIIQGKELICLPRLQIIFIKCDILFAYALLRRVPDPSDRFLVDAIKDTTFRWYSRPSIFHLHMYDEVFDRIVAFWERKTGESYLPSGRFVFNGSVNNHTSRIQIGRDYSDTVLFRSAANIYLPHSFWPHCTRLSLTSAHVLLSETMDSLSRISEVIVDIPDPGYLTERTFREWLLKRSAPTPTSVAIEVIYLPAGFYLWNRLIEDVRLIRKDVKVHWMQPDLYEN
jgi:hypothetical protein